MGFTEMSVASVGLEVDSDSIDAGCFLRMLNDQTTKVTESIGCFGSLGILEFHHSVVTKSASQMLEARHDLPDSLTLPLFALFAAKIMSNVWFRHDLARMSRRPASFEHIVKKK